MVLQSHEGFWAFERVCAPKNKQPLTFHVSMLRGSSVCATLHACDIVFWWFAKGEPPFMIEITIKLPDTLARAFGATPEARSQRLAEDAAIEEYRAGRLSQRQVGEMLGLDYWQTERFLAEHNVALNYSLGDLQADQATLDEVLGRP